MGIRIVDQGLLSILDVTRVNVSSENVGGGKVPECCSNKGSGSTGEFENHLRRELVALFEEKSHLLGEMVWGLEVPKLPFLLGKWHGLISSKIL
jgi:hypothetical protein